jgi:hypothetical protein
MEGQGMKPSDRGDRVVGFLQQHPVASFEALEKQLQVSRRTVRRALAKHGYYSSCNGNGTYVTLRETPQFTPEGLWVYRKSCFSSHGTLLQTIVALVEASPAGKTLAELEEHLGTRVHNQVSWLLQDEKLTRVYSGRHVVYLACDSARAAAQQRQRPEPARPEGAVAARIATGFTRCPEGMRAETVIRLLVQMIATPKASPASLAKKLQAQGLAVQAEQVRRVIEFYALEKKTAR